MSQEPEETIRSPEPLSKWPRFRIVHLVYLTTLLSVAMATLGTGGLYFGIFTSICWAVVFVSYDRPKRFDSVKDVFIVISIMIGLLFITTATVDWARNLGSLSAKCSNNLKQIHLALHTYHDTYDCLPPAYIADKDGKPMHSWRVLILPFLEEDSLYAEYDFSEPWDGPNNSKLHNTVPYYYECDSSARFRDSSPSGYTNYVAVTGPNAAWNGATARTFSDFNAGTSTSIMLMEVDHSSFHWMEPRDISSTDAIRLLTEGKHKHFHQHEYDMFFYRYALGRNVLFADGNIEFVDSNIAPHVAETMIDIKADKFWRYSDVEFKNHRRLNKANCLRFIFLVAVIAFPLPWVGRNPRSGLPERPKKKKTRID